MSELIITRHGETELNVAEVFRGRLDVALNRNGLRQAGLLAGYLGSWKLEAVYSSPLKRAVQTATPVALAHNLEVQTAPGLNDLDFGEWQGMPRDEVNKRYPELYAEWMRSPHLARIPGADNLDEVRGRAAALVEELIARHKGAVVLVTHRVVSKVLICYLLGLDNSHFWNIRQDNCGVTVFDYEKGLFILARHNDTSFLDSEGRLADF